MVRFLDVLVWTDRSSTGETAKDRYIRVFLHVHEWYTGGDIWDEKSKAGESISKVRKTHNAIGKAFNKKHGKSADGGIYMSQYDMAMVQAAFVAPPILLGKALGFNSENLEDWTYFWRCLGYLLGIDDEHNICSSTEQAVQICYDVMYGSVLPGLKNPPPNFKEMASAYCEGTNMMAPMPMMSLSCSIHMFYRLANTLKDKDKSKLEKNSPEWVREGLTFGDKFRIEYWKTLIVLIKIPGMRQLGNKWAVDYMTATARKSLDLEKFYNKANGKINETCPVQIN